MKTHPRDGAVVRRWRRPTAMLPILFLFVAACGHSQSLRRPPPTVEAAQSDSPAISPWAESPPDVSIGEDPAYTAAPSGP
jgi:hypothetical protein